MLIPYLHLNGCCRDALTFYEKVFYTKTDSIQYVSDTESEKGIIYAEIHIHGQRVTLNDRGGNALLLFGNKWIFLPQVNVIILNNHQNIINEYWGALGTFFCSSENNIINLQWQKNRKL